MCMLCCQKYNIYWYSSFLSHWCVPRHCHFCNISISINTTKMVNAFILWQKTILLCREILWRTKWLPTPIFLPRKSPRQRSLVGYSSWCCKRLVEKSWNASKHIENPVLIKLGKTTLLNPTWPRSVSELSSMLWTYQSMSLLFYCKMHGLFCFVFVCLFVCFVFGDNYVYYHYNPFSSGPHCVRPLHHVCPSWVAPQSMA